ncbi:MAG: hypothetical protein HY906_17105 [Deltaproteobacteria bacterium]|nr:hypothetical protein [Deltaproteobacteria bacterium]
MRRLPLAVVLMLGATLLWPPAGYAQDDAPISKEQEELNKQREKLNEQREADAVVPLNEQLQRVYRWLATLSLSWELHRYRRPPLPGQPEPPIS